MGQFSLVWICNYCNGEFGNWSMARKHSKTCKELET